MLPNHTTKKWQNTNSNPGLPALPRPDPKIDHCLNWCCAHIQMSLGGRGRESFYYSSMDGAHSDQCLHRHCQQELLDSCTISSSCSSLSVFKCGSLLLFSCLMGFLLLNPSDETDPAVLGIIPSDEWWPQDWRQLTCRQREGVSEVPPAPFGLMTQNNSGSRALGIGLNQQSFSILGFEVECFGIFSHMPSFLHSRYWENTLSLITWISCHTPPNNYHWTDCIHWVLFPVFMLHFARIFHW